jgi:predicted RNase H-like HicB family nuclease
MDSLHRRVSPMLNDYIKAALKRAEYKRLEDGSWFAEIRDFEGVWANGKSVEECRTELQEVLEEWLFLKINDRDSIPEVDGLKLKITHKAVA